MIQIIRILDALPEGFGTLRAAAREEGMRHIDRLAEEYLSDAETFSKPGEALFAACVADDLVAVGGVTREPSAPNAAARMRRFYVLPHNRGAGVGRALAGAAIQQAAQWTSTITVNARNAPQAFAFWEALGFAPVHQRPFSHVLNLGQVAANGPHV
ncbi:MAG: GNAT family N-acetyltransferase [Alphaproteobacteria bacterium]|nr:GNAT family N-acetyltransferase [Alphaproteobacteria bacterium]